MRVGEDVQNLEIQLVHKRAIFGAITGKSGVRWQAAQQQ